jgi:hypothetical protein
VLRELNASIRNLADAEQLRQNTETTLMRKKFKSSLGVLGSWAAGGVNQSKSSEHELEEAKAAQVSTHREEVLFYLRRKLHECGGLQASMMETRITREIEKNKSMLEKSRSTQVSDFAQHHEIHKPTVPRPTSLYGAHLDESVEEEAAQMELSPEQLQMFEQENADMLKHYEATLNQVRYFIMGLDYSCYSERLMELQDGREVPGGDLGTTESTCTQPRDTVGAYPATCRRFRAHGGQCGWWEQATQESDGTEKHGEICVLCVVWTQPDLGCMGSADMRRRMWA